MLGAVFSIKSIGFAGADGFTNGSGARAGTGGTGGGGAGGSATTSGASGSDTVGGGGTGGGGGGGSGPTSDREVGVDVTVAHQLIETQEIAVDVMVEVTMEAALEMTVVHLLMDDRTHRLEYATRVQ